MRWWDLVFQISCRRLAYAIDYWSGGKMEALFLEHEGTGIMRRGTMTTMIRTAIGSIMARMMETMVDDDT
jgi:pantothenate kinase